MGRTPINPDGESFGSFPRPDISSTEASLRATLLERARLEAKGIFTFEELDTYARPQDFEEVEASASGVVNPYNIDFSNLCVQGIRKNLENDVKGVFERTFPTTEYASSLHVVEFSHAYALNMFNLYERKTWFVDERRAIKSGRLSDEIVDRLKETRIADAKAGDKKKQLGAVVLARGYDDLRPESTDERLMREEVIRAKRIAIIVKTLKVPVLVLNVVQPTLASKTLEPTSVFYVDPTDTHKNTQAVISEHIVPESDTTEEVDEDLAILLQEGLVKPSRRVPKIGQTSANRIIVDPKEL